MDQTKPILKRNWKAWLAGFLNFALIGFSVWAYITSEHSFITAVSVSFSVSELLMFVTAGLCGPVLGMAAFLAAFTIYACTRSSMAYFTIVLLLGMVLFLLFALNGFFRKLWNTVIAIIVTSIICGGVDYLALDILQNYDFTSFSIQHAWKFVAGDAVETILAGFALYFFFRFVPDSVKTFFPNGRLYVRDYKEDHQKKKLFYGVRVKLNITTTVEAVLLIVAAVVLVNILFPDLQRMLTSQFNRSAVEKEVSDTNQRLKEGKPPAAPGSSDNSSGNPKPGDEKKSISVEDMQNVKFVYNSYSIAFDIKLLMMLTCLAVPIAILVNFMAEYTISRPLHTLSDYMRGYTRHIGEEDNEYIGKIHSLNVKANDEIGDLYFSIDNTVSAMEVYVNDLKTKQKLENDLKVAKAASDAKSSFLSNMSHEIRTPINAVLGMNEMILRESDDKNTLVYANNIASAGHQLLSIVNDILDFSKIEAGKMEIIPVDYDISSTINDLITMVKALADKKGLTLNVKIDSHIPCLFFGDEIRVKQCVTNILTNAVKYTEKGSVTMEISGHQATDSEAEGLPDELRIDRFNGKTPFMLKFRVVDTGIGMKEEDLGKLFSPFERIDEIRNRSIEGTGLGMSIVKKLLAMMNTKLNVKSVYGEGSDFSFEVLQQVVKSDEIGDFTERYRKLAEQRSDYHEAFHAPDAHILITDDNAMNLMVVTGLLKRTKIQIDTARSGAETLEKTKEKKYDMIFLDHLMPEMDGIETLKHLKEDTDNPNHEGVPCIALTANAVSGAREQYLEAGFDDYLTKPVDGPKMELMIKHYLRPELVQEADADKPEEEETQDEWLSSFRKIPGINADEALKNCGTEDILKEAVNEFQLTIPEKSGEIEDFFAKNDWKNYTIRVHALKSSARLIGALDLSKLALDMEMAGKDSDERSIKEHTPELLETYCAFKDLLIPVVPELEADDKKPLISKQDLIDAYEELKALVDAFDFDGADRIVGMLEDYRMPDDEKEKWEKIRVMEKNVDHDGLMEVL